MTYKTAADIFAPVDPKLQVVGRKSRNRDWKSSGGTLCPWCALETVRFIDGVCPQCAQVLSENYEKDLKKRAKQIKFIKQHNARLTKKKKKSV